MKAYTLRRYFLVTLSSLFAAAVLTACGGGGSSSGSSLSAGGASISGNVNSGIAFNETVAPEDHLLATIFELMVSNAHAAGVSGVKVDLLDSSGNPIDSMITGADGEFQFSGLAPGTYRIQLTQGTQLSVSQNIQLQENTRTRVNLSANASVIGIEIEAENGTISGEVEDGISSDDQDSTDDVSNDDQDSTDDASSSDDDVSEDNPSEDECDPATSDNCDDD